MERILKNYSSDNPGVKTNIMRILMHGELSGTGKIIILPVDQGFEHGPSKSFGTNPNGYDPEYHVNLAIESKLNAYAAPLGMLECISDKYIGKIPLILKANSSNLLNNKSLEPDQTMYGSVKDALRLGCVGIGFTIYPGSDNFKQMAEIISEKIKKAKEYGLVSVVWAYPRGSGLPKEHESSVDVISYAAHIACLIGAHIIKVKIPNLTVYDESYKNFYNTNNTKCAIQHVVKSCFDAKRIVIFSGGPSKDKFSLLKEASCIKEAGGNGSIVGRNAFQRTKADAMHLLQEMIEIYKHE